MTSIRALVNGKIIDGIHEKPIENGVILLKDDVILDVGTSGEVEIPENTDIIDVRGMVIMPGLIDAHIHITGFRSGDYIKESLLTPYDVFVARAIRDLESILEAGFTTICDAGSTISLYLKQAIEEGTVVGPRIIASGYPISQTFGHGDIHFFHPKLVDARETPFETPFKTLLCDGADECRKAARYALREGADFIKIFTTGGVMSQRDRPEYPQMTIDEIQAVVEEARRAGKFVHAHAEGAEGFKNALVAGVKVLAHGIYIDDDGINLSIENDAVVIPTLSIVDLILKLGSSSGLPEWGLKKAEEVYNIHVENIKRAYKAGVKLAVGTDFFVGSKDLPIYGMNAMELSLLVNKIGMKPMDAIIAGTRNGARAAGLAGKIGELKKDGIADMIVVEDDPLKDISILMDKNKVMLVFKEGKIVKNIMDVS